MTLDRPPRRISTARVRPTGGRAETTTSMIAWSRSPGRPGARPTWESPSTPFWTGVEDFPADPVLVPDAPLRSDVVRARDGPRFRADEAGAGSGAGVAGATP